MKNNLLFIIIAIFFIGCNTDNFKLKSKACFDYSPTDNLKNSDTIKFSNCSLNSNYYFWDFGDGSFSYEKNPKHVFKYKQSYKVKLFIANRPLGDTLTTSESDTISRLIDINIGIPKADFSYLFVDGFKVSFSNTSLYSTNFKWDFGDGTTSIEKEPVHFYNSKGPFIVKLKASDTLYSDSILKNINLTDTVSLNNQALIQNSIFLDVDGDKTNDFELYYAVWGGISGNWADSFIVPGNNYEVSLKKYCYGDNINFYSTEFSNKKISITSAYYLWATTLSLNFNDSWDKSNFGYLAIRKKINDKTLIGWIKLKATSSINVHLISYRIPSEIKSLIIDE